LIYYYCDPCKQPGAIIDAHSPEWELFDLDKDPYELHNIYSDPANQELVQNLKQELARQQALVKDLPFES
jgi:arylsulfatase A-like enzyme